MNRSIQPAERTIRGKVRRSRRTRSQSGYMLLAILLMMTLMIIAASAVAPKLATQIRREREFELIHRGTEYAKAIRRYYRKFGRYPTKIEDLENTNTLRFLRKRYTDPITGKDDWKLIHFGEAKNGLNLFGAPAGGGSGTQAPMGGGMGGGMTAAPGSVFGAQMNSNVGTPAGSSTSQGSSTQGSPGSTGSGSSGSSGTSSSSSSAFGGTFGGGPIIGVASPSEQESLMELQGKTHYNEWEFVYDPRFDRQAMGPGLGAPTMGAPGFGAPAQQGTPPAQAPATPPQNPGGGAFRPPSR